MLLTSFLEIPSDSHFPIQNLPFGIFSTKNTPPRVGVRIGDFILDLTVVEKYAFFGWHLQGKNVFAQPTLNKFMEMGKPAWRETRTVITNLLRVESSHLCETIPIDVEIFNLLSRETTHRHAKETTHGILRGCTNLSLFLHYSSCSLTPSCPPHSFTHSFSLLVLLLQSGESHAQHEFHVPWCDSQMPGQMALKYRYVRQLY